MAIDTFASEIHFADHLAPVYRALSDPGDFIINHALFQREPIAEDRLPPSTAEVHDTSRPVLVASYGDVKKARHQNRKQIAFMEHGIGQSYIPDGRNSSLRSYAGGPDRDDVGLFLVPNEYAGAKFRETYPDARVEVIGSPKLDSLPAKDPSIPLTVAVSFHWDCYLVPETVSAFGHFRFVLDELKAAYNLIGHGHPRAFTGPPMLERRYRRLEIPAVQDFADVCRQADLYICDNSSSLYEFASTGRPVVVMNSPNYRKDVHHGLRFWEAIPGIEVDSPGRLLDAVALALTDPPHLRAKREAALDMVYAYRSGAAQRAAAALEDWA